MKVVILMVFWFLAQVACNQVKKNALEPVKPECLKNIDDNAITQKCLIMSPDQTEISEFLRCKLRLTADICGETQNSLKSQKNKKTDDSQSKSKSKSKTRSSTSRWNMAKMKKSDIITGTTTSSTVKITGTLLKRMVEKLTHAASTRNVKSFSKVIPKLSTKWPQISKTKSTTNRPVLTPTVSMRYKNSFSKVISKIPTKWLQTSKSKRTTNRPALTLSASTRNMKSFFKVNSLMSRNLPQIPQRKSTTNRPALSLSASMKNMKSVSKVISKMPTRWPQISKITSTTDSPALTLSASMRNMKSFSELIPNLSTKWPRISKIKSTTDSPSLTLSASLRNMKSFSKLIPNLSTKSPQISKTKSTTNRPALTPSVSTRNMKSFSKVNSKMSTKWPQISERKSTTNRPAITLSASMRNILYLSTGIQTISVKISKRKSTINTVFVEAASSKNGGASSKPIFHESTKRPQKDKNKSALNRTTIVRSASMKNSGTFTSEHTMKLTSRNILTNPNKFATSSILLKLQTSRGISPTKTFHQSQSQKRITTKAQINPTTLLPSHARNIHGNWNYVISSLLVPFLIGTFF